MKTIFRGRLNSHKFYIALFHDSLASCFAWLCSYYLRFNFNVPVEHFSLIIKLLPLILIIQLCCFCVFGLYKGIWRFASVSDLKRILLSVSISILIISSIFYITDYIGQIPRSVFIIDPMLLIFFMGGSRLSYRFFSDSKIYNFSSTFNEYVVIAGVDHYSNILSKELLASKTFKLIGFIDNDQSIQGKEIFGVRVIGKIDEIHILIKKFKISKIIIAARYFASEDKREIIKQCALLGIQVLTTPRIDDLLSGRSNVSELRSIQIEDLLGRDEVQLGDLSLNKLMQGKTVLVTGAGGSIGSELCRQIMRFSPKLIICLDISEIGLYKLEQELIKLNFNKSLFIIGDVKNKVRLTKIFSQFKPKIIFHAAAYKHVPLMEVSNISEALINNVIGTHCIAQMAKNFEVEKFVLISSDKAVNPTNVMGASKQLSEIICRGIQLNSNTDFIITRFGNVLGSSGSVIPRFREQIQSGGPLTITHPQITRYFMSIPEATQLVMQACLMGSGNQIFILDMGMPVKIVDLAKDMIKLSGLKEDSIKIEFTGLRPGEKLYEELISEDESTILTSHAKLKIVTSKNISKKHVSDLVKWVLSTQIKNDAQIKKELKNWVSGYKTSIE